jgi:ATP-dependent Lhr-like helicase
VQLRELLGDAELRELLDADALAEVESQAQQIDPGYQAKSIDGVHDLLLRLGDLTSAEVAARSRIDAAAAVQTLIRTRRAIAINLAGESRIVPVEYAGRYRDALGVPLPTGLPESLLQPAPNAHLELARRYARTHGPFTTEDFAGRYGLGPAAAQGLLKELSAGGRLLEGEFRPGGSGREWCDPDILQAVRRRSLAKLRREVEPVEPPVFVRLLTTWQGLLRKRSGLDALLDAIEHLQGVPMAASVFESEILSARVEGYNSADLDALCAAGEVVWCGVEPLGERDGRLAIYLTDQLSRLRLPRTDDQVTGRARAILEHLAREGASFFTALHQAAGGGYPAETVDALWDLVWKGLVTNDTFHALRAFTRPPERRQRKPSATRFRTRRVAPPAAEGRWSLVTKSSASGFRLSASGRDPQAGSRKPEAGSRNPEAGSRKPGAVTPTEWSTSVAQQLLSRYGVLTREVAASEGIYGGFSAVYDVLKALEDAGRIRRGYFVGGVGATQFALPAALELMRSLREMPDEPEVVVLAATDPANPFGTMLKWPDPGHGSTQDSSHGSTRDSSHGSTRNNTGHHSTRNSTESPAVGPARGPTRTVGAQVILINGTLAAYLSRGARQVLVYLPEDEPQRSTIGRALSARLAAMARTGGLMIGEVNGVPTAAHPIAPYLAEAGFSPSAMGFMMRRPVVAKAEPATPKPEAKAGA